MMQLTSKRRLIMTALLVAMLLQIGCGDGMGHTRDERFEQTRKNLEEDRRQFMDDWDSLWLLDAPGASRWKTLPHEGRLPPFEDKP